MTHASLSPNPVIALLGRRLRLAVIGGGPGLLHRRHAPPGRAAG